MSFDDQDVFEDNEIKRDRYGRYLVMPPGGKKWVGYTRCTTYVKTIADNYNLQQWEKRMVAVGLSMRPELMLAIAADRNNKELLTRVADEAKEAAQASAKATIGTALHSLTERIDCGQDLGPIPAEYKADLDAYQQAMRAVTIVEIERMVILDDLQIGGKFDRIVQYQGHNYIADIKTGSIEYGINEIAMQLAVYAHGTLYDQPSNTRTKLPGVSTDEAIVIHMPAGAGTCTLHWVNIKAGWQAVDLATRVREWRKHKGLTWAFETATAAPTVADLIAGAPDIRELTQLWRTYKDEWTPELTAIAAARKAQLTEGNAA